RARPDVEYAEPDYVERAAVIPNDPYFSNQWGYYNTGQTIQGTPGIPDADIDAPEAWDIENGQSNPVNVAVIDTGADFSHPDLDSKILSNGYNWAGVSQINFTTYWPFGSEAKSQMYAQSIKGTGQSLTHVGVALVKAGAPSATITVAVRTSLGGADLSSYSIAPAEVGTIFSEIYKPLSSPVTLTSGTTYYLVFSTSGVNASNFYFWLDHEAASDFGFNAYPDGEEYWWDGVSDWDVYPDDDVYFRTNPNAYPRDDNGHGTHCSGIVGAESNNSLGVAGTSFGAKILPLKALDASGSGYNDGIISAIYYAADTGAKIISMSLGSTTYSSAFQDAVNYAYGKGATIFASAGNDGDTTMNYPAGYDHVVGVGATTNSDQRAAFSNYNTSVDVSAPGKDIYSTTPTYSVSLNSLGYTQNYSYLSGTSMACPMAAGLGALVLSRSPALTPAQVEQVIESNADDLGAPGRDNEYGYGRINACKALGGLSSPSWYLAEGTTAWGFSTYISIENPNTDGVNADITYMTGSGAVTGPSVYMPPLSQATVSPSDTLGSQDFSTKVTCREGKTIAADRTMTWTGPGAASEEAHNSVGVRSPSETWYLAEGSSAWGFECWLLIQNPNPSEATCTVTYMIEGAGPQTFIKKVPASSRATFNMSDDIGEADASIKVTSNLPVIPERAMYRNNRREGHDSIGTTSPATDYFLAEGTTAWGFTTYVLVQNPQDSATDVTVTYMTNTGPVYQTPFTMPANSRKTIRVNDILPNMDLSTRVHGSQPIIAERAMYWDNGTGEACHDSIGMASAHSDFYLPDGETSNGRETWTLVQNPGSSSVAVEVSYLSPSGSGNVIFYDNIGANSRKTYNMADQGVSGRAAVKVRSLTPGQKIMVERAMYWSNRGAGTDTIGGYSD
ncbi:MAG: S8 family serine peptidase, partial [Actinobacteria bacterium]|nr:S8 family serine peptidase [Actinomycetota bacterium]